MSCSFKKALLSAIFFGVYGANALVGDVDKEFGLDGNFRTINLVSLYDKEQRLLIDPSALSGAEDGSTASVLRLVVAGKPSSNFSYETHLVSILNYSSSKNDLILGLFSGATSSSYRAFDASWSFGASNVAALFLLDRFNLSFDLSPFQITIGRQAITFGNAHFWNLLDVFSPFGATDFDRDYKGGVDALRLDLSLGDFSGLVLVGALGRNSAANNGRISWLSSALLVRGYSNFFDWDFSIQGGKIKGGGSIGIGTAGQIGSLGINGEASLFIPMSDDDMPAFAAATLGANFRFEFGLMTEVAYLYNGGGDLENYMTALTRVKEGRILHMGQHIAGAFFSYELSPLIQTSLAYLASFSDWSQLIQPGVIVSVSDESDLVFGGIIGFGKRPSLNQSLKAQLNSEFGSYPAMLYFEFKYYF